MIRAGAFATLILCAAGGLIGVSAHAARPARVDVEEAPVYETLTPGSRVIRTLPRGSRIVISNLPTQGFYKIRTNEGEMGWVSEKGLQVLERPTPEEVKAFERRKREYEREEAARLEAAEEAAWAEEEVQRKSTDFSFVPNVEEEEKRRTRRAGPKRWLISGFYGTNQMALAQVRNLTGLNIPTQGRQFGLEVTYTHSPNLVPLIFRIETLLLNETLTEGSVYRFEGSSTPLMVGARLDLGSRDKFAVDLALLFGISVNQTFRTKVLSQAAPNEVEQTATSLAAMAKMDIAYSFVEDWWAFIEIGYRSLRSGEAEYKAGSELANGGGIFFRDGALKKVSLDMSGFFASLGVSYNF